MRINFIRMHQFVTLAALCLLIVQYTLAQNTTVSSSLSEQQVAAKVDDFIKSEMQKQRIPGASLAVVKNGQIVLAKGYGFANVEHQVAVKPETIFQSASVGKQFTATAVLMLVEEGKIKLDEKIGKYLGEVPDAWKNITVRHLLTHTSGMTDYPKDFDFRRDYTEDELLKVAQAVPVDFQPGEKWQYSNLGYVTLGFLIRKVTGKFYGDFLQERIFKPLGMTTARIISESDIVPNRAAGYRLVNGELKNQEWVSPSLNTTADGALYLTVLDMAKWDAALYGEKLLKKTSLEQMWRPVKLNDGKTYPYGFGWALGEIKQHRFIEHTGGWQGFKSLIVRYPEKGITVIIFFNFAQARDPKLAFKIAGIYNPELAPPPTLSELLSATIAQKGIASALQQYRELKRTQAADYDFSEPVLNRLGYDLLETRNVKEAIEIFKLNVEVFPQAFNVYDSLAEAYMENGDKDLAIKNYEKSLELNPQNTNAVDMLMKLRGNK